jgi:signal transduction histidine kinase
MSDDYRVRNSVFVKLITIMLVMAASLLALVGVFFLLYVGPSLNRSVRRVVFSYAQVIAKTTPDYETAKQMSRDLHIEIRYEGPRGSWTTAQYLPTIDEARRNGWTGYPIEPSPDGGQYLFAESFMQPLHTAHRYVLWLLLFLMVAVVVIAYAVLRRLLRPVRELGDGVALLSNGQLDVIVPQRTRDEFGALAAAFNRMVSRVRDMIRARDQLLLDVSHELRSPVTRMKVALELLPEDEKTHRIAADLDEMELMISELLELERLREGRIRKEPRNIVPILEAVVASCGEHSPGVRIVNTAHEIILDVDVDKLQTVIRNLVENAMKYSLPDSHPVEVSAVEDSEQVIIRIKDDGPGIPEDDLENIFEPFFRVDRSRSRKSGGYGLGLSISRRIVEAHAGTITAMNNAGRGASFVATLPKDPTASNASHTNRSSDR